MKTILFPKLPAKSNRFAGFDSYRKISPDPKPKLHSTRPVISTQQTGQEHTYRVLNLAG